MLRRAFRGAFGADELDDIYASAWVGTLRALEPRHEQLSDDEIRSYVFTAVAHQAGKELRRRKRKPVAPLELASSVADSVSRSPEDSAATAEESRVTRDLLASLPARRRAVILLRYGWGLEPKQICALIKDLSPRAYRKEMRHQFGVSVDFFCYPAGAYDDAAIAAVRAAGYLGATTTEEGLATPEEDPDLLSRIRVEPGDGAEGLEEKIAAAS
jgi:RNA polymerase sigma factor (sigma-70 family)